MSIETILSQRTIATIAMVAVVLFAIKDAPFRFDIYVIKDWYFLVVGVMCYININMYRNEHILL